MLPTLQQIADAGAAVIERARLGEEEWRNRLGVAHARGHLAILAEAAVTLSAGVDSTDEAFRRLGRVLVPGLRRLVRSASRRRHRDG